MEQKRYQMKWFKFIIYVELFVEAVVCVLAGIFSVLLFSPWGSEGIELANEELCTVLGGIYGVALSILGVYAIIVRKKLVKYKSNAPMLYYIKAVVLSIMPLIFFGIMGLNVGHIGHNLARYLIKAVIWMVVSLIYFVLIRIYFKKRADLFVN